jgi:hypothetical protein
MTLRRWITFGSAAALIAAASACSDSGRNATSPEGRAGSTTSRARTADAGSPEVRSPGATTPTPSSPTPSDTAGTSGTSGSTGSTSSTGNTSGSTTGGETKK